MSRENRLIDADALSNDVDKSKYCNPHTNGRVKINHYNEHDHFLRMISDAPTVDAVEVVHARWETNCDPEECEKDFYCSVCEELICDFDTTALYPGENCYYYCPNCGAKMDGGNEDGK